MASPDIPGRWQLTQSDNFDAFMSALGVGYLTRKLGNASKPLITVQEMGPGQYSIKQESLVKTTEIKFKIGEPFDETTADGRQVSRGEGKGYPTTNGRVQNASSLYICGTHCLDDFARLVPICMLVGAY